MVYDTITVEEEPRAVLPPPPEDEGNDSNASFSASETGGEGMQTGGLDSAGEEDQKTEGEPMDLS